MKESDVRESLETNFHLKKFLLISPKNRTVYNFRGDLIRDMIRQGYEVIVTGPDEADMDRIRELGVRFVRIPMNKTGTSVSGDLKYCFQLYRLIRKEKPDITLGYTIKPVVYGAMAARLAGVRNINSMVTGGGYTFTAKSKKARMLGRIVRILYRIGFFCTEHAIFQNQDDQEEFCRRKLVKREKCHVVNGSGVNMEYFHPCPLPAEPAFFMLSRLLKSKGVREYLSAAQKVKERFPEAKFYLLGKYEPEMQDAVPREEVEHYIEHGIVKRFEETTDVRPYYEMCSVYVLPSYREGTPRTVLEAMAMGRPVITTDTNGCRETVQDQVNGFLVPVQDSEKLAECMMKFLEHPEQIEPMGKHSIEICKEKFEITKINKKMMEIMEVEERKRR